MKSISKKIMTALVAMILALSESVYANETIKVQMDNQEIDLRTRPVLRDGMLLVPVVELLETIGEHVTSTVTGRNVKIENNEIMIELMIGKNTVYIYKKYDFSGTLQEVVLNEPIRMIRGKIYTPAKLISIALGAEILWDERKQTLTIYKVDKREVLRSQ